MVNKIKTSLVIIIALCCSFTFSGCGYNTMVTLDEGVKRRVGTG